MNISQSQKKHFRTIGHSLNPIIMIGDKGMSESIGAEIERALEDHELIKIKINGADKATKKELGNLICEQHKAHLIQLVGNIILIYRAAKKPNPKLSNLLRHSG